MSFHADKYTGYWQQVAAVPQPYQRGCAGSSANYRLTENNGQPQLQIKNCCYDGNGKELYCMKGTGTPTGSGKFAVNFGYGDGTYQVLGTNYNGYSVVSDNGGGAWVLQRPGHQLNVVEKLQIGSLLHRGGIPLASMERTQPF